MSKNPRRSSILKRMSIGPLDSTKNVAQAPEETLSTTLAIKRRVSFSSKPEIRHIKNDSKSDTENSHSHSDMDLTSFMQQQQESELDKTSIEITDMDITATEEDEAEAAKDASVHLPYDMEVSMNKTFIGNIENISNSENIENSNSIQPDLSKSSNICYKTQEMDLTNFSNSSALSKLSNISFTKNLTLYQTQDMSMNSTNTANLNLSNSITRNKTLYQTQNMNLTAPNLVNVSSSIINRNQTLHQTQDMNMTNINSNSANNITRNKTLYQTQDMNITNYNNTSNSNNTFYHSVQTQDTPQCLSNNSISANRSNSMINKNTLYQTQEMELTSFFGFGNGSGNNNNSSNQSVLEYSKGKTLYQTQAMELTDNSTFANIEKESNSGNKSNSNMDLTCGIVPNPNAEQENTSFNNKMQSSDMEMTSFAETPSNFINKINKTPVSQFKLNEVKPISSIKNPAPAAEPSPSRRVIKSNKDKRINEPPPPKRRNIFSSAPLLPPAPANRPVSASNVNLSSLNILNKIRAAKTPRRPIIPKSMLNPIPSAIPPKKIKLISSACQTSPHLIEVKPKETKEQGCNVSVIMSADAETEKDSCEISQNQTNINEKPVETIRNNIIDLSLDKSHDLPAFKINNTNNTENIFIQKESPSLFSETNNNTTLDQLPSTSHLTLTLPLQVEASQSSSENSSKVTVVAAEEIKKIKNSDPTITDPIIDSPSSLTKSLPSNSNNSPSKIEEVEEASSSSSALIKNGNENEGKSELDSDAMSLLSNSNSNKGKDTINNNQSSIITDLNITSPKYKNQTNENETLSESYLKNTSKDCSVRPDAQKITFNDSSIAMIFDTLTTIAPLDLSEEKITISDEKASTVVDAEPNENISASSNNKTENKVQSNETTAFEPLSLENISCMATTTNTNNNDNNTIAVEKANYSHSFPATPVSASKDPIQEEESMEIEEEEESLPLLEEKEKSQLIFNTEKTFTCGDNNIADDVDIEIDAGTGETCTDLQGKENCLPNETIVILNNSNEPNEVFHLKMGRKSENNTGIDEINCSGFYTEESTLDGEELDKKEKELSKTEENSTKNLNTSIFTIIGPKLQYFLKNYNKLVHLEKSNALKDALEDLKKLSQEQFDKLVKSYPDIFDNDTIKNVYASITILASVKKSQSKLPFFDPYRTMFYGQAQ